MTTLHDYREAALEFASRLTSDERRCLIKISNGRQPDHATEQGCIQTLTNAFLIEIDMGRERYAATRMGELVATASAALVIMGDAA